MKLNELLLSEGPFGVPYTQETFTQSFNGIMNNDTLGGDRGALLCASAGVYVDMRPCAEGVNVMVYGFNPSHPALKANGRWEETKVFTDPNQIQEAHKWVESKVNNSFPSTNLTIDGMEAPPYKGILHSNESVINEIYEAMKIIGKDDEETIEIYHFIVDKLAKTDKRLDYRFAQTESGKRSIFISSATRSEIQRTFEKIKAKFPSVKEVVYKESTDSSFDNVMTEEFQSERLDKRVLVSRLYKQLEPLYKGLFKDEYWQPINAIWKKLTALGLEWHLTNNYYEHKFPPTFKIWEFEISFTNKNGRPDKLFGRITASGAGSVQEPLDKYDVTVVIS